MVVWGRASLRLHPLGLHIQEGGARGAVCSAVW